MPFRVAKSLTTLGLACQYLPLFQHIADRSAVKWLFCGWWKDLLRVVGSSTYYRKNRLLVGLGEAAWPLSIAGAYAIAIANWLWLYPIHLPPCPSFRCRVPPARARGDRFRAYMDQGFTDDPIDAPIVIGHLWLLLLMASFPISWHNKPSRPIAGSSQVAGYITETKGCTVYANTKCYRWIATQ